MHTAAGLDFYCGFRKARYWPIQPLPKAWGWDPRVGSSLRMGCQPMHRWVLPSIKTHPWPHYSRDVGAEKLVVVHTQHSK